MISDETLRMCDIIRGDQIWQVQPARPSKTHCQTINKDLLVILSGSQTARFERFIIDNAKV